MPATRSTAPATPVPPELPTIYIVEDDILVCDALRETLETDACRFETFTSAEAFLAAFDPRREACLLLDSGLPGISGLDLLHRLRQAGHSLPTVMITGRGDLDLAVAAMKTGAVDFIQKPVSAAALIASVTRALDLARDAGKAGTERDSAIARLARLTPRQREVMELVLAGHPNKNIAQDLALSQRTVETHRSTMMKRAGTRSLPDLARLAFIAATPAPTPAPANPPATPQTRPDAAAPPSDLHEPLSADQFRRFFDQVPIAILVAAIAEPEVVIYANPEFTRLAGRPAASIEGQPWSVLTDRPAGDPPPDTEAAPTLGAAITTATDFIGTFRIGPDGSPDTDTAVVDAYSNVIEDEDGTPSYRLAALVDVTGRDAAQRHDLEQRIRDKDALLREIQHRVKNNLQMITALIRIEARAARGMLDTAPFDRLAGRIESMQLIYRLLADTDRGDDIDLGIYLSEIVSSVMRAHAVEGIRLDLKLDSYPVSVNVALPAGLVVNELLTNAIKHAFVGRETGTITLRSLSEAGGCRVVIADDGIGLPPGTEWPKPGKLGELIVRSLRQNARANLTVESTPETGTRVTITFSRAAAAPDMTARTDVAA